MHPVRASRQPLPSFHRITALHERAGCEVLPALPNSTQSDQLSCEETFSKMQLQNYEEGS